MAVVVINAAVTATLTPPGASPLHRHNEAHISLNNARPSQNAVGLLFCVVSCLCVIDVYFPVWVFECVRYVYLYYVSQLSHGCG